MNYRSAFLIPWLVFFAYWIVHWKGNKPTIQQTNPILRIFFIFGLLYLCVDRGQLPASWHRVVVPHTPLNEGAGLLICCTGVAIAIWARRVLGTNWSANPTIKEGHELVEAGPYRLVRHPIYTGLLLAILGSSLGGGRPIDLVVFLFCRVSLFVKLKIEEGLMLRQFPQAYPDYMQRTKALVPYVL